MSKADKPDKGDYTYAIPSGHLFCRQTCFIPDGGKVPGHPCVGANRILDFDGFIHIEDLIKRLNQEKPQTEIIPFGQIWHQLHSEDEKDLSIRQQRFVDADTTYPGIVARLPNPDKKEFRLLDGRRRMWKQQSQGLNQGEFYVIPEELAMTHFWMVIPFAAIRPHINAPGNNSG